MVPVKYNVRSLFVRKTTTAAAALGLALVVFVFASVLMLGNGIRKTMGRAASPNVAVVLRKGSDAELSSGFDTASLNLVKATAGQVSASGQGEVTGEVVVVILLDKIGTEGMSNVTVRGVPDGAIAFRNQAKIIEGRAPNAGAADEVIVGKAIRGRFKGLEMGQSFELKKNRTVKVVGVFTDEGSSNESEVWGDLHAVASAFGREGYVSSARVKLDSPGKFDAFKTQIEQNRQLGLIAMREAEFFEKQSEMTATFMTGLGVLIAVFFSLGAMIGAMITMHAQVASRQKEIGTLRALGFSRFSILTCFLLESLLLALVGGGLGAVASLGMGMVKITLMNASSWSEVVFTFDATPAILMRSMILAGVMGIVGGFLPALRAARVSPVEAMRA